MEEEEHEPPSPAALATSAVVFYAFLVLLAMGLFAVMDLDPTLVVFGEGAHLERDTLIGAAAGGIMVWLTRLSLRFEAVRALNAELQGMLGTLDTPSITIMALTSSIGEEILFRGALQPLLGLLPTAILFGFMHGGIQKRFRLWVIFTIGAGLVLGALTAWTDNLLAAILCHFTVNYFNLHTVTQRKGDESA